MTKVRRMLTALVAIPVLIYLALLVLLFVYQRQLLYFPDRSTPQLDGLTILGAREIRLTTADGLSLLAWYLPPPEGHPVVVYFHGNGGNIGYRADRFARFAKQGYGVLMPEYRGYGGNPGSPSEDGLHQDATAALAFLDQQGIAPSRVVLYGESLGTGVAVRLAAERPVAAVVLESPYTSIAEMAQYHYPFVPASLMVLDRFDSLSRIAAVKAPILVLSGGQDPVIPRRFAKLLYDTAPEPKEMFFAPEGHHEDLENFGALDAVFSFIDRHVRP